MYPHIRTTSALTVVLNDKPYAITSDHPNYQLVLDIVRKREPSLLGTRDLLDLIKPIEKFKRIIGNENSGFEMCHDVLKCVIDGQDFHLPDTLYDEVLNIHDQNGNLAPLYNFVVKLAKNPRREVISELWGFISSCGLAITEQGNFLAYKNVNNNFKDVFSGTMDNSPGQVLTMPRWKVEHDPNRTCAAGLHFAAWSYLKSYASGRKTVILSISPEDVVSIPTDYNNMKGRACRYKILREVDQPEELKDLGIYREPNEFVDTSAEDSQWIKWSKSDRKAVGTNIFGESILNELEPDLYVLIQLKDGSTLEGNVGEFSWSQNIEKSRRIVGYRIID